MPSLARQTAEEALVTGPGVPYHTFMGIIWAGAGLACLFMILRLISRWRGPGRLYWDDACAGVAAVLVLITAALWQWAAADIYYFLNLDAGLVPLEADFPIRLLRGLKASLVVELFFYTSLFLVKMSFLLFFRRLGSHVRGQKYIWWPVFALAVVSYLVSVGDVEYHCLVNASVAHLETYCSSQDAINFTTTTLIANCVLDVLSDFAIMLIPFVILWNVRIPSQKKFAFIGLFSLSIITIAVAIARTADLGATAKASGQQDSTYLWMWSAIQSSLAVVVSCLSAFPQLFAASARETKPQWTPTDTYYQRLKTRMQNRATRSGDPLYDISAVSMPDRDVESTSYESQRPVLRPEMNQLATQCSVGPHGENTLQPEDQIMRKLEYRVVEHPAANWNLSQEQQMFVSQPPDPQIPRQALNQQYYGAEYVHGNEMQR